MDLHYVTAERIADLKRKAEEVVRMCDEMIRSPDMIQQMPGVRTAGEPMPGVQVSTADPKPGTLH